MATADPGGTKAPLAADAACAFPLPCAQPNLKLFSRKVIKSNSAAESSYRTLPAAAGLDPLPRPGMAQVLLRMPLLYWRLGLKPLLVRAFYVFWF